MANFATKKKREGETERERERERAREENRRIDTQNDPLNEVEITSAESSSVSGGRSN